MCFKEVKSTYCHNHKIRRPFLFIFFLPSLSFCFWLSECLRKNIIMNKVAKTGSKRGLRGLTLWFSIRFLEVICIVGREKPCRCATFGNSGRAGRVQSVKLIENWLWLQLGRWRERSAACRVVGLIPHLLLTAIEVSSPVRLKLQPIYPCVPAACLGACVRRQQRPHSGLWESAAYGTCSADRPR